MLQAGSSAPASFGSVGGGSTTVTGSDDGFTESVFIAKYSITGNLLWVQTAIVAGIHSRSLTNNQGHGVAVDADANTVYVTGVAQADTDFSSFDGTTHTVRGPYTWHMFLVKYDLGGNFYWGETNEASPNTVPHSIAVDSQNGAYVTGWFEHLVTFYSHDGRDQTISGRSEPTQTYPDYPMDTFIAKYDSDGNLQWVNDIGGYIAVPAVPDGVAASRDGRIAVTGYIGNINGTTEQAETIVTSQPGGSNINLGGGNFTTPYNRDIFIAIYSSAGVLMSASRLGSEAQDSGSGIDFDNRGNLYVAGVFGSTLQVGNQVLTGTEPSNLFVLKYTKRGLAYAKSADGGAAQNVGLSPTLSVAKGGRVWVTGAFTDTATFDSTTLQSAGAEDIFVAELK